MLGNIIKTCSRRISSDIRLFSSVANNQPECKLTEPTTLQITDTRTLPCDNTLDDNLPETSILEPCQEDISDVAPYLKPSFNFAAYVNKSKTLQQLVQLGVKLYKWEKNAEIPPLILQLDFDKDMKSYIVFLSDLGLQTDDLRNFIEKNPFIFREGLENLQIRINYLKSKRFTDDMILRILQDNPNWLNYSTQEIDNKLGFFQKKFLLTGDQVRSLTVKKPRLITYNIEHIKLNTFVIKEEMGFTQAETKQIILQTPKLFMQSQHKTLKTFEFIHKEMNIPLETIAKMPSVLTCREFRIRQRHKFLEKLGKVQYDPKEPNYISLITLVSGSDSHFATEIAGSSINAYNAFLKTM